MFSRVRLERWLNSIWYGRSSAWVVLYPLTLLYRAIISVRAGLYSLGLKKSIHSGVPTVVIGNITAGGSGKTPLVAALALWLKETGVNPGLVSRGYGRSRKEIHIVGPNSTVADAGDEALMLYHQTGLPVCVGADRAAACHRLHEVGVDIILSDDGLQHYRMARDLEIVVVDGDRGFGNGRLLPSGPLRESQNRLESADFCVTRVPSARDGENEYWLELDVVRSLEGSAVLSLDALQEGPVYAVAAIANPSKYFDFLSGLGLQVESKGFPDHHPFSHDDFAFPSEWPILMTAKDAVKCKHFGLANAWVVETRVVCSEQLKHRLVSACKVLIESVSSRA